VRDLVLPEPFARAWAAHPTVQDFEARQALAWEYAEHRDALPPVLRGQLDRAQDLTAPDYDAARREAHRARRLLKDLFSDIDGDPDRLQRRPRPARARLDGGCAFQPPLDPDGRALRQRSVPGDGLPLGVQVIARFGDDGRALAVARMIEGALRRGVITGPVVARTFRPCPGQFEGRFRTAGEAQCRQMICRTARIGADRLVLHRDNKYNKDKHDGIMK
jgi:Asp-tRNA(Asn)/Glu-tRNA(Gln) amidotransferase A subunit family amidase